MPDGAVVFRPPAARPVVRVAVVRRPRVRSDQFRREAMERDVWQRAEPVAAAGLVAAAVAWSIVAVATGGSLTGAGLIGLTGLALGAVLGLDSWRRAAARAEGLERALTSAREDAARAVSARAAAEEEGDRERRAAAVEVERREAALVAANRDLEALGERAARQAEEKRVECERLREALRRAEDAGARQRQLLGRLERSRRAEREWNRELRAQLQRLYESPGRLAGRGDVGALVLEAAMRLVDAEKGMLLSRADADGDGALDVAVADGFEHDPRDSVVAQRFARQVLALEEIVRDDRPDRDVDGWTAADDEIDSLVAIPVYLHDRFHGVIVCANRPGGFEDVEDDVLLALGDQAGAALHHGQLRNELREAPTAAVRALLEAIAARDPHLHQQSTRLTVHAVALARALGLDDRQRDVLTCATLLRNIGYLAVPERLLNAPRPLRPDERAVIELHPRIGFNVVGQVAALREVAEAVLYHHERFDGAGYPSGLAGEDIPRAARVLAVLEAYSAMTSERSFRERRTPEEACVELVAGAGTQFDPAIAELLVEEVRRGSGDVYEPLAEALIDALPLDVLEQAGGAIAPLAAASTDGLTLLGNQRALVHDVREASAVADTSVAVLVVQLEDVPRINQEIGYEAGDRIIQLAARNAQRTAARFGGRAYRSSGRRLAVVAPLRDDDAAPELVEELRTEFAAGPTVRTTLCVVRPGERAADVLIRARRSLLEPA
jgi:HD-GYP domain-containing protein (c-di-GMP phosphodiesterase class II)